MDVAAAGNEVQLADKPQRRPTIEAQSLYDHGRRSQYIGSGHKRMINRRGHQESQRRELQGVMEEITSISTLPVKCVLNTHYQPDHVGNNHKR